MTLTTPALLFPALSLLLLAYTNRFLTLAGLVRELHKSVNSCVDDNITAQIKNLRERIVLIRNMQFFGIASLFFCVFSMLLIFINKYRIGEIVFGGSLILLLISLGISIKEIKISVEALNIQLNRCETGTNNADIK